MSSEQHEIHRMENEGGLAHPDGVMYMGERNEQNGRMDPRQAAEIARLRALTSVDGPGKTSEQRAIEALRAMLFTLELGMDDMLAGGEECPATLDGLLRRTARILGMIRGVIWAPPIDCLADLIRDCQDALAAMEKARKEEWEARRAQVDERYSRLAAGMGEEPGPAPAN